MKLGAGGDVWGAATIVEMLRMESSQNSGSSHAVESMIKRKAGDSKDQMEERSWTVMGG